MEYDEINRDLVLFTNLSDEETDDDFPPLLGRESRTRAPRLNNPLIPSFLDDYSIAQREQYSNGAIFSQSLPIFCNTKRR